MTRKYKWLSDWFYYFGQLPLLSVLPRPIATRMTRAYSSRLRSLEPERASVMLENLRRAFPRESGERLEEIVAEVYETQAQEELETFYFPRWSGGNIDRHFTFEGLEHLERAAPSGRGALLFTAHLGSFTSAVCALGLKGIRLNYLAHNSPDFEGFHPAYRRYARLKIHWMEEKSRRDFMLFRMERGEESLAETGLRSLVKLRQGELVSLAIDVPPRHFSHSEEADFLGLPCRFPNGFLHLARQARSPVIPFFALQNRSGRPGRILFLEPVSLTGDLNADMQQCVDRFASVVRRYPGQWFYWDSLEHFAGDGWKRGK